MKNRGSFSLLRWISLIFTLFSVILFTIQLARFSRTWANMPFGLTISGVPVGGLNRQQASERLLEVFSVPVEIHYNDAVIQLSPSTVGFELDMDSMLAAAELERTRTPFWSAFWNYLWGRQSASEDVPLKASLSTQRLRSFLADEVASRYDHAPTPAMPIAGTTTFQAGMPGTALDVDRSILLIESAMYSTSQRVVDLPLQRTNPPRPAFANLQILLKQVITTAGYDGLMGLYMKDMQTGEEISFSYNNGQPISYEPGIAFTGSSTIKIPIMISVFRHLGDTPNEETTTHLEEMIGKSINPASDWLMQNIIDPDRGPLMVTEDMQTLGLKSTFLAGYFYNGAPLLMSYKTPANQRPDISTDPDPYNQTTPVEMGMLLSDVYECSENGGGALIALFPGQITQAKCKTMINYLVMDHNSALIQAGVPDGTKMAHKHGWVLDPVTGIMHNASDAALVFTPGGNYVLSIYLYHPTQLVYDPINKMVADLSRAVYNFYNPPATP